MSITYKIVCPHCRNVISQCGPDTTPETVSHVPCHMCQIKRVKVESNLDVGSDIPGGGAA
jgi:hypothetical protein